MKKNLEIERLRAIAVLMTFVTHCSFAQVLFPTYFKVPMTGVDLFFVISGFVVTCSLMRTFPELSQVKTISERMSLSANVIKCFFIRRIFRILPAAYFWLLFYFALAVIFGKTSAYLVGTPSQIFKEIVYFSSGFYNYLGYKGDLAVHYLGHFWSLAVEEHFYLLLPFFFILAGSRFSRIFSCVAVILIVAGILRPFITPDLLDPHSFNYFTSHRRFDTLALGVLLALIRSSNIKLPKDESIKTPIFVKIMLYHILPLFFLMLLWCGTSVLPPPFNSNFGLTIYGLFALGLVLLASFEKNYIFNYKYLNKILEFIGERSYTIYLSQIGFICLDILFTNWLKLHYPEVFGYLMEKTPGIILHCLLLLSTIIAVSDVVYRIIEKPMIKYAKERYNLKAEDSKSR